MTNKTVDRIILILFLITCLLVFGFIGALILKEKQKDNSVLLNDSLQYMGRITNIEYYVPRPNLRSGGTTTVTTDCSYVILIKDILLPTKLNTPVYTVRDSLSINNKLYYMGRERR